MESLLSSLARLADPPSIAALTALLAHHGALGRRVSLAGMPLKETDRLKLVPLVFGLMPRGAFVRVREDQPIKPSIIEHLRALGIAQPDTLVSVLKAVCDQYWETRKDPQTGRSLKRKFGMSDIRAMPSMYRQITRQQNARCDICGEPFGRAQIETLDHIVPFRLVGDISDGSNWRILCEPCNSSKSHYLSSLQALPSQNWVYGGRSDVPPLDVPNAETRYVLLTQHPRCAWSGCSATPRDSRFSFRKRLATGLAVADNLEIVCEKH